MPSCQIFRDVFTTNEVISSGVLVLLTKCVIAKSLGTKQYHILFFLRQQTLILMLWISNSTLLCSKDYLRNKTYQENYHIFLLIKKSNYSTVQEAKIKLNELKALTPKETWVSNFVLHSSQEKTGRKITVWFDSVHRAELAHWI